MLSRMAEVPGGSCRVAELDRDKARRVAPIQPATNTASRRSERAIRCIFVSQAFESCRCLPSLSCSAKDANEMVFRGRRRLGALCFEQRLGGFRPIHKCAGV